MGVPYEFDPGEIAASSQVNANFTYITDILGDDSVAGELHPDDAVVVGTSGAKVVLSNRQGIGVLSWNVEDYLDGTTRKYQRQEDGKPATAVELDENGFSVKTTSATQGDVNSQLQKVFGVHATSGDDWIYIPQQFHIQRTDKTPTSNQDYRLTYVPLTEPIAIHENEQLWGAHLNGYHAEEYVPADARAIQVVMHLTAWPQSGAAMEVYPGRKDRHWKHGVVCHAYGGDAANFGRSGGGGTVPLGTGEWRGIFVVQRTAGFAEASLYIQGYWV